MNPVSVDAGAPSGIRRVLDLTIVRIVLALFTTALAGGLAQALVGEVAHRRFHAGWPDACGALAALAGYALYVRVVEQRAVAELGWRGAVAEIAAGLAGGAALVGAVVGSLVLVSIYRIDGVNAAAASGLVAGFAQMMFVGVFEELLMRAVLFRLLERSLGSWAALVISSLLFGLAHLPGNGAGTLALVIAIVAGAFFGAAWLATRRLWLCAALHVGWNFTLGHVFSAAVSGHERTPGLVEGHLQGPDWVTGGAYGLEASVLTLAFLAAAGTWLLAHAISHGHLVAWRSRAATPRPVVAATRAVG
ncbi:CPBP family intramembrane glutamic endopeptidase [Scleromatobacter humisilvae]|uniref:CPBP family intramembrane metalloprotease n=1 Tax=Scleromatobacter humisilvae TaxID=2897159 RepID=A0A9X2BZ73_9BURK|nr:CPBP family intramembrane glutamic endopeptidase [Scleromatobacter humisilvae]MCK9685021.1 CPBP family intramembrane metalloprotease [Scleromatobacter humisilvae]